MLDLVFDLFRNRYTPAPIQGDFTMRLLLTLILMAPIAAVALDLTDKQRAEIEARIKPFSEVCVQGQPCGGGSDSAVSSARSGEDVYNAACMACHEASGPKPCCSQSMACLPVPRPTPISSQCPSTPRLT